MSYYTYLHKRPDNGLVFYVGCGNKSRPRNFNCRTKYWFDVVEMVGKPIVEIVSEWATQNDAWEHEKVLIRRFREIGHPLVNQSDGGKTPVGVIKSEETRKKQGMTLSMKTRGKDNPMFGKTLSVEHRKKLSDSLSGKNHPQYGKPVREETKAKISSALIGRFSGSKNPNFGKKISDSQKAKLRDANLGKKLSEETKAKMSSAHRMTYKCSVCNFVSRGNGIALHQKATKHEGKEPV